MLRHFRSLLPKLPRPELPWNYQHLARATRKSAADAQPSYAEPLPLSRAVVQLEELVMDDSLPQSVIASNQASLQTLKSFLGRLVNNQRPKASITHVKFSVRNGTKVQPIRCQLKTTGGDCSMLVANSLGDMLAKMGLNPHIYFDGNEFEPAEEEEPSLQDVAAVRAKAAAAGVPSQTITEEEFQELEEKQQAAREGKAEALGEADEWSGKLRRVDPLFAAVAAVPWMPTDDDGSEKRRYVMTKVLDELEAQGWDIRGAAHRVWRGERELQWLTAGKNGGSQAAIQSLVYHALKFDDQYGRRTLKDVSP